MLFRCNRDLTEMLRSSRRTDESDPEHSASRRLPAHIGCDFWGLLHHFRRELLLSRFGGVVVGRFSESEKAELWDRYEAGESLRSISRVLGRAPSSVRTHVVAAGWRRPVPAGDWCALRLSFGEREEISRGIAGGESLRRIARCRRRLR